jgi:hypothetical protein
MYGTATAIAPISSLVRRSKPVYVTLDCKYRLADETAFLNCRQQAVTLIGLPVSVLAN